MTFAVNLAQGASNNTTFRNRIINGAMVIDQRNNGASVTPTSGQYTLDRWAALLTQTSRFTVQQNAGSVTPPAGFSNYLGVTSSSAYSVLTGDTFLIDQRIEGFNFADMAWGTANAQPVTLSFWVRSSLTGTFGGAITNSATNRNYLFGYTVSAANTWTQISVTIPGDTSGTWVGATNGIGAIVRFGLGSGATFAGTTNTWQAGNLVQPTGTVSVVGTNGATFYITGVQLEEGTAASPFEFRQYGTELALCQRYFFANTDGALACYLTGYGSSPSVGAVGTYSLPTPMRASPTVAIVSTANGSSFSSGAGNRQSLWFTATVTSASAPRVESFTASSEL